MSKNYDILVIDDERIILDAVKMISIEENYSVDSVLDAPSGLELLEKNSYKLVICDIMMPEMNGFDFLEQVKSKGIKIPILMITGYSTTENFVKSLNLQAFELLPKPFTSDELIYAMARGFKFYNYLQSVDTNDYFSLLNLPAGYRSLGINSFISEADTDGTFKVGITNIFSKIIGTPTHIQLLSKEEYINQGQICCHIENTSHIDNGVLAPLSGRIIEVNEKVAGNLDILSKANYTDGWIYRIIPTSLESEFNHLHK